MSTNKNRKNELFTQLSEEIGEELATYARIADEYHGIIVDEGLALYNLRMVQEEKAKCQKKLDAAKLAVDSKLWMQDSLAMTELGQDVTDKSSDYAGVDEILSQKFQKIEKSFKSKIDKVKRQIIDDLDKELEKARKERERE